MRQWLLLKGMRRRQAVLFLLLALLVPFSFQCVKAPLEPKAPTWTTQLTIPLVDRTYYFSDMISKDSKFDTLVNGEVIYRPANMNNAPTPINVPDLSPVKGGFSKKLGIVPLSLPPLPPVGLSIPGVSQGFPVPPGSVSFTNTIVSDTASYAYVIFEKGRLTLTVNNLYNFDISMTVQLVDTIVVTGKDAAVPALNETFNFGTISAGTSKSIPVTVDGKRMSSILQMRVAITVPTGTLSANNGSISSQMSIDNGTTGNQAGLSAAKVRLTGSYYLAGVRDSSKSILDDSTFLKRASFSDGEFTIHIANKIDVNIVIGFELKEFRDKSNRAFQLKENGVGAPRDSVTIIRNTDFNQQVLMSSYDLVSIKKQGNDTLPTQDMTFSLEIKTLEQTNDKRRIAKDDSVLVEIIPKTVSNVAQPYKISYVEGKIAPNYVPIKESFDAGIGDAGNNFTADSVNLDGTKITLKVFARSLFRTDMNMKITGFRNGVALPRTLSTPVGTGVNKGAKGSFRILPGQVAEIIFDKDHQDAFGTTIKDFISTFVQNGKFLFPDKFEVAGYADINPKDVYDSSDVNVGIGKIYNHDSVYTSLEFYFPVRVGIRNGAFRDTLELAQTADTAQINSVNNGKVFFNIENAFPMNFNVTTRLMKSKIVGGKNVADPTAIVLTIPQDTTDPVKYPPIKVLADTTANRDGRKNFTFITLTSQEAAKVAEAGWTAIDMKLQTGNDNGASSKPFRRSDRIHLKAFANISFNVDFDKLTK